MKKQKPCELYRHFDKEGRLLYAGISYRSAERVKGHKHSSHWFDRVTRIEIERFATRAAALEEEKKVIQFEQPIFNVWTDKRRGINCRSDAEQLKINRLIASIEKAGYRVRRNSCLNVLEVVWKEIQAGRKPDASYLRKPSVNPQLIPTKRRACEI